MDGLSIGRKEKVKEAQGTWRAEKSFKKKIRVGGEPSDIGEGKKNKR